MDPSVSKISVVLSTEVIKILIAAGVLFLLPTTQSTESLKSWSFYESISCAGIPSVLYAIQNLFIQYGYLYLDSMTFNLLNQTKTLSAAFFLYLLLGIKQSKVQILALGLLLVAGMILYYVLNRITSGI